MISPSEVITGGREFFIEFVLVFSAADDLAIHLMGAYDFAEFVKGEIIDICFFMNHARVDELFGFFQQSLLINEVTTHHAVFGVFTITDETPEQVDMAFCFFGFLFTIGQ